MNLYFNISVWFIRMTDFTHKAYITWKMDVLRLFLLLSTVSTVAKGGCKLHSSLGVWPLGRDNVNREIVTNLPAEGHGIFNYTTSPLTYEGLQFYGNTSSYVDLLFDGSDSDFSLYFYINPSVHGGYILHYKNTTAANFGLTEMKLQMEDNGTLTFSVNGNGVVLANGGSDNGMFVVSLNQWSIVIMKFDISKTNAEITVDDGVSIMDGDVLDNGDFRLGPGIMRIASSLDGSGSSFEGGITCLHKIAGKDVCEHPMYATRCEGNLTSTTSIPTTTLTSTTSTTVITTQPNTPTTTSSTVSHTSTQTMSTNTTLLQTTTLTSTAGVTFGPVKQNLTKALRESVLPTTGCRKFKLCAVSAVYSDMNDVIGTSIVNEVIECLRECTKLGDCSTFSFNTTPSPVGFRCQMGKSNPNLQNESDCYVYSNF